MSRSSTIFGGFVTLSYAPCSVTRSASCRFSASYSTTTGGCEGILHQESMSRKPGSQSPFVLAARRSSSTTSHHSRNSFRLLNSNSLPTLYSNALPSARAIAPVRPESWLTKHTCTISLVKAVPSGRVCAPHVVSKLQRHYRGFREEPSEIQLVGLQDRSLPLPSLREQFCKGFTDRKRCAIGAIIGRKSIRLAKLVVLNQITKVMSKAQARRTPGSAFQMPIVCILLLCYFPIARYMDGMQWL